MVSALPFDDIRGLLAKLLPGDPAAGERARAMLARDRSAESLGRLADIAVWLAIWTGRAPPAVTRPSVAIFAGTHGVAPGAAATTAARVADCAAGRAAINHLCAAHDLGLKVYDLALDLPTGDITREAALDERGCAATMAFGMEATAGGIDLLCLSDLGGGGMAAAAVCAALRGGIGADWTVTAMDAEIVDRALALHRGHIRDPLEVLRRLGGREIAAIAGAILAARMQKVAVILDGAAALAAAGVLQAMQASALDHCLLAQRPSAPAQARMAQDVGLVPLLDLGVAEGGADALAAGIVKAAAQACSGLAAAR